MAKRGKKPTPSAIKKARGNPGRRPLNEREPTPPPVDNMVQFPAGGKPSGSRKSPAPLGSKGKAGKKPPPKKPGALDIPPPEWLTGVGVEKWGETVRLLLAMKVLTAADLDAVAVLCSEWERMIAARAVLATEGTYYVTKGGDKKRHPAAITEEKAKHTMRLIWAEFGMTASSRTRIAIPQGEDPLKDVFNRPG